MTIENDNRRADLLTRLMEQYDELLAAESPAAAFDESVIQCDTDLSREWQETKDCLELLHRANRRGNTPQKNDTRTEIDQQKDTQVDAPPQIGRFRIKREIGRGGMGVVFLAYDPQARRNVAVKVPRIEAMLNGELRRRFLREAEAAARLNHPNLVTLHEVGEDNAICYLACEYCDGPNLAQWLSARSGAVRAEHAATLVLQLAEGVEHAHSRGVLHRDIKPSNVLLQPVIAAGDVVPPSIDANFVPKLTDFGMAKLLESAGDETRTGAFIGTAAYMAPEQAEGRVNDLDARTDVYALGVVFYELLVGKAPFRGKTDIDTLRQLVHNEPVAPRRIRPDIPRDLEAIALKCLGKRPADRYATAHELATDLRRFLSHESTIARPLSWWQRTGKWAKRHPTAAALAAVTFLGLNLLVAVCAMYTVRLSRQNGDLLAAIAARDEAQGVAHSLANATARSYPNDMRVAQQAWKEGRVAEAKILLEKHQPRSGGDDHRAFAWHFLWRLCHLDGPTLKGHKSPVYVCRYSPDGRLLATGGEDGELRLWNSTLGTSERSWPAHQKGINGIAISPDGKWLATTAEGQNAAVWEAATGNLVHRFGQDQGTVLAVTFTPDGKTLVAGGATGEVLHVNTVDWSIRARFFGPRTPIAQLAVSPDGALLATAGEDFVVRLWNLPDVTAVATLEGHTRDVTAIDFSHDGSMLASASRDGTAKLWDVAEHRERRKFDGYSGYVHQVAFTPDDRWVLTTTREGDSPFWDTATGNLGRVLRSGSTPVYAGAVSPDGRQVATAGGDSLIHLWNGAPDPEKARIVTQDSGTDAALAPGSQVIAVGDEPGKVGLYDVASSTLLKQLGALDSKVTSLSFANHGNKFAIGFDDSDHTVQVRLFPELTLIHACKSHAARVLAVRLSPDGALMATCAKDGAIKIWNTENGSLLHDLRVNAVVRDSAFSPDGRLLAGACSNGTVRVWRVSDGAELSTRIRHEDEVLCVAWSPDGKLLASGSMDDTICLQDIARFEAVGQINARQRDVVALAFSPDGRSLASGGDDRTVRIWDVQSQEQVLLLEGHRTRIGYVSFSAQGDFLVSVALGAPCEVFRWPTRLDAGNWQSHIRPPQDR